MHHFENALIFFFNSFCRVKNNCRTETTKVLKKRNSRGCTSVQWDSRALTGKTDFFFVCIQLILLFTGGNPSRKKKQSNSSRRQKQLFSRNTRMNLYVCGLGCLMKLCFEKKKTKKNTEALYEDSGSWGERWRDPSTSLRDRESSHFILWWRLCRLMSPQLMACWNFSFPSSAGWFKWNSTVSGMHSSSSWCKVVGSIGIRSELRILGRTWIRQFWWCGLRTNR